MGCTSGKVAKPTPLSKNGTTAQHTLLASAGKDGSMKEASKPSQAGVEGAWSGGVIKGTFVTWTSGSVFPIRTDRSAVQLAQEVLDSAGTCDGQGLWWVGLVEVSIEGDILRGELMSDDRIHWSDGKTWSRHQVCSSFQEYSGYIDHGPDLLVQTMSLEEAMSKAASMPTCQGITYKKASDHENMTVYFKSHWNITGWGDRSVWRSHKVEVVGCAVGDQVTAIFGPTGMRYAAEIQSVSVDLEQLARRMSEVSPGSWQVEEYSRMALDASQITVSWQDGGKTHCVLPASHVFKDGTRAIDAEASQEDLQSDAGAALALPVALPQSQELGGLSKDDLQSGADAALALPAAPPQFQELEVAADDTALTLPHLEDPRACSTRIQAPLSGASPSSALMQASTDVDDTEILPSSNGGPAARPARKEKSMCCC